MLVVAGVPAAAVLVSLLALRRVVAEPLGVVRRAEDSRRRRLWWRLLLPAAGLGGGAVAWQRQDSSFAEKQESHPTRLLVVLRRRLGALRETLASSLVASVAAVDHQTPAADDSDASIYRR